MDNKPDQFGQRGYLNFPQPMQHAHYQIPLQMELDQPGLCAELAARGYKVTLYPHLKAPPETQIDLRNLPPK